MKLSEALQERADLNRRIEQLRVRLSHNATVQEGESPSEDPKALLLELDGSFARLEELIYRINLTNCKVESDGKTLTQRLAERDCLNAKLGAYRSFLNDASQLATRATRTEIKIVSTVQVASMQKTVDALSANLRKLDTDIQALNWTTELL